MRSLLIPLLLVAAPATAWEASSDGPVCRLDHELKDGNVTVSYDPRKDQPYAIDLDRQNGPWADAPVFALRFDGPGQRTISTDRHQLSDGNDRLTVTDKGFGNVLSGLATNFVAIAMLGEQSLIIPLTGAAPEVERFVNCITTPSV